MDARLVVDMVNHIALPEGCDPLDGFNLEHLRDLARSKKWLDGQQMSEIRELQPEGETERSTSSSFKREPG